MVDAFVAFAYYWTWFWVVAFVIGSAIFIAKAVADEGGGHDAFDCENSEGLGHIRDCHRVGGGTRPGGMVR